MVRYFIDGVQSGIDILLQFDPNKKIQSTRIVYNKILEGKKLVINPQESIPDKPERPAKPVLVEPKKMPGHKELNVLKNVYLLHSIAHIELNAIDLCWDTIVRFARSDIPIEFFVDFIRIANDEARHFDMLCKRMNDFNFNYGDIPAHSGIWDMAIETKDDLLERITGLQLGGKFFSIFY